MAELPQRRRGGLAEAPFQFQVVVGPWGLGAHAPAGRIYGRLHRHATIHQVGNDLQVRLHLPEGARSATHHQGLVVPPQHPGVQGVNRTLSGREPVWTVLVEAEAAHPVVQQDARIAGDHAVATVEAVDVRHDIAGFVHDA